MSCVGVSSSPSSDITGPDRIEAIFTRAVSPIAACIDGIGHVAQFNLRASSLRQLATKACCIFRISFTKPYLSRFIGAVLSPQPLSGVLIFPRAMILAVLP